MGKVTGFLELDRQDRKYRPAADRVRNFKEFFIELPEQTLQSQASRCMDCGIPFCHDVKGLKGCPVNNQIPDWNDLVYRGEWENAIADLHSTNNFPEFTGRICPAPCEASCTLNIIDNPVTIKSIECAIVDKAWKNGWIKPQIAEQKTGKKVAVIGSGPAGLAASQQLARVGHEVHLYEKNSKLFHSKKEVEDLYQNISKFALLNGLSIISLKKSEPKPVSGQASQTSNEGNTEQNSSSQNNEGQQVLYFEIPVEYEIRGNFLSYLKFRRALSKSSKVINYDKEEITTLTEVQGQILSKSTISIVGLPNEYE